MIKNIIKLFIAASVVLVLNTTAFAQSNYKTGIGVRLGGFENGLTIKHFTNSETAIEGILGFRRGGFVLTGLYEKHTTAFAEPSLNFFYGIGGHVGGVNNDGYYRGYGKDRYYGDKGVLLGVDGVLGLEWKIPELPIALSVDLQPRLELARGQFLDLGAGLSIRYTF